jgi:hypothetical protein
MRRNRMRHYGAACAEPCHFTGGRTIAVRARSKLLAERRHTVRSLNTVR